VAFLYILWNLFGVWLTYIFDGGLGWNIDILVRDIFRSNCVTSDLWNELAKF